jgi:dolichol-phosphate mannosyltransferase
VRRQLLSELPVAVPGFKIALALLAEYGSTVRVAELPISFRDRDFGKSKMSSTVALAYLGQLTALFFRRIRLGSR